MKLICISILLCIVAILPHAQPSPSAKDKPYKDFRRLKVGEQMPPYELNNLINYPSKKASLSDFKGKLLIFDFWNTACAACIEAWPKMLDLQKKFNGKLQIILVNPTEDEQIVRTAFDKRKIFNIDMNLPSVCGDTVLGRHIFKHDYVPHYAWIDKDGIVKAITSGDVVNEKNILALLNNVPIHLPEKNDDNNYDDLNFTEPLFLNNNGGNGEGLLWYSVLTKFSDKFYGTFNVHANNRHGYSIYASNSTIPFMYRCAYTDWLNYLGQWAPLPASRVVFDLKDSTKYEARNKDGEDQYQNYYTYQLISFQPVTEDRLKTMMQSDLKKYFSLDAHWETKRMKCLVLTSEDTLLISYKSGDRWIEARDYKLKMNNQTVKAMLDHMVMTTAYSNSPYPLIDETGYTGKIGGIDVETNILDHEALDKALQKYKMHFTLQERDVRVLVVSDNL